MSAALERNVTVQDIAVREIATTPFADQRPGTSGLRKKVPVFEQPHYLENFVQAIFDTVAAPPGSTLVVGGVGIKYNTANGGPAPERVTDAIATRARTITRYVTFDAPPVGLERVGAER